jgi:hypothetical protein
MFPPLAMYVRVVQMKLVRVANLVHPLEKFEGP